MVEVEGPTVSFDDDGNVRVLDTEKFKVTQEIDEECTSFMSKIKEFEGTIHTLVGVLGGQSKKIEQEKLKALGQRNRVEGEAENRKRKQDETKAQIREKQAELERYGAHFCAGHTVSQWNVVVYAVGDCGILW